MKTRLLLPILALLALLGCRLPRPADSRAMSSPDPASTADVSTSRHVANRRVADLSISSIKRLPPTEDRQRLSHDIQLASYELQPRQDSEHVVPEVLDLPTPTSTEALTLYDLEQMALSGNAALGQAAARIEALQGRWVQVGLYPNPMLGYAAEEMGDDGTAGKQGAYVSQQFILGKKLHLNRAIVEQEIARAEAEYAAMGRRVRTDVQMAFYSALLAQRRLSVTRDLVGIAEEAVEASEKLLKAEEVGKTALLQSQVEANTARILLQQAENARRGAWRKLTAVVGIPGMPLHEVVGEVEDIGHDYEFEQVLQTLNGGSPELAAAYSELERARWALSRAEVEPIPDVKAQVVVQHDNATGDDVAGVQIGIPLPLFDRNQGGIQQAWGEIAAAEQNAAKVEMRLRSQLADVFQSYADARVQVERYRDQILPQAKETLELTEKGYRAGEMDFLTLLTAQRTYFQTNLNYLNALRQYWNSSSEIDGLLLRDSLNSEP